jgi:Flp pilus assembly protein TadB
LIEPLFLLAGLPVITPLDLLVAFLVGALALTLLTWPRARPRIGRAHLGPRRDSNAVTLQDPFLLRLAAFIFRPWLVQLGRWYRPQQRSRQEQQLLWAGLENISLGAWVGLHLIAASIGIVAMACLLLLFGASWPVALVLLVITGGIYAFLPEWWLRERTQRRDRVMESQLVAWLRAIASQLRGSTPLLDAIRLSTEVLQRGERHARLQAGLTDLYAEATMMSQRMDQGQLATDALAEMAERCHQNEVRTALLGMRRALLLGSTLAETLNHQARTAQQRIRARRLRSLGRRLTFVTGITVVAAFLLYVGSIGGVLIVGLFKGFSALH